MVTHNSNSTFRIGPPSQQTEFKGSLEYLEQDIAIVSEEEKEENNKVEEEEAEVEKEENKTILEKKNQTPNGYKLKC